VELAGEVEVAAFDAEVSEYRSLDLAGFAGGEFAVGADERCGDERALALAVAGDGVDAAVVDSLRPVRVGHGEVVGAVAAARRPERRSSRGGSSRLSTA